MYIHIYNYIYICIYINMFIYLPFLLFVLFELILLKVKQQQINTYIKYLHQYLYADSVNKHIDTLCLFMYLCMYEFLFLV